MAVELGQKEEALGPLHCAVALWSCATPTNTSWALTPPQLSRTQQLPPRSPANLVQLPQVRKPEEPDDVVEQIRRADVSLYFAGTPIHTTRYAAPGMRRISFRRSRMRESRTPGSVRPNDPATRARPLWRPDVSASDSNAQSVRATFAAKVTTTTLGSARANTRSHDPAPYRFWPETALSLVHLGSIAQIFAPTLRDPEERLLELPRHRCRPSSVPPC